MLLRGPSGAGKSDLALRLLEGGATLVADDRVTLIPAGRDVRAAAPAAIRGLLEVRGVGIVRRSAVAEVPLRLVVDLVTAGRVERLPEPQWVTLMSVRFPLLALAPFECSAPAKLRVAVGALREGTLGWAPDVLPVATGGGPTGGAGDDGV